MVFGSSSDARLMSAAAPTVAQTAKATSPILQVDPLWPKPLPNHWLFGSITGVAVDAQDHVWVVHRGDDSMTARTEIGAATNPPTVRRVLLPAPPVLEFDPAGKLVEPLGRAREQATSGRVSPGGIAVDAKGNVWITAAGARETARRAGGRRGRARRGASRPQDAHVLKFSRAGKFLLQIGKAGTTGDDDSTTALNRPAAIDVDAAVNEVYVADGFVNHRVVVFDAATGAYKRHWGANGRPRRGRPGRIQPGRGTVEAVQPRELRRGVAKDGHGLRLRSPQQSHPGLSTRTARS